MLTLYAAQRMGIRPVAVCGLRSYPPLQNLRRGRTYKITTSPAIGNMQCYAQYFLFQFLNNIFDTLMSG